MINNNGKHDLLQIWYNFAIILIYVSTFCYPAMTRQSCIGLSRYGDIIHLHANKCIWMHNAAEVSKSSQNMWAVKVPHGAFML